MNIKGIYKYVSMAKFLPDFCGIEYTNMIRHKMRGMDGNGKKIGFTKDEKIKIQNGRIALNKYLKTLIELDD